MGLSTSTDTWIIIWTIARAITVASLHAESVRLSTVLSSTATQCMMLMATKHRAATDNVQSDCTAVFVMKVALECSKILTGILAMPDRGFG